MATFSARTIRRSALAHWKQPNRYQQGNTTHHFIFRQKEKAVWSFGPWTSDARFFYFCVKDQRVNRIALCGGSFVRLNGESLISQDTTLQWLEWTRREAIIE